MQGAKWEPSNSDRLCVKVMRAGGKRTADIARMLGVSLNTLKKKCALELATGKDEIDSKVAGALVKAALSGNVTAQIFYLKTRCQWSDIARDSDHPDGELRRFVVTEIPPKAEQRNS